MDGVTLAAGTTLDLSTVNGAGCYLNNTMTINGTVLLGNTGGTTYGRLYWNTATTVWGGSGEIIYGANGSNGCFVQANNTSLTIASPLKIHGISGYFYSNYSGSALINNGIISSDGGGTFTMNFISWTNNGTLSATSGSTMTMNNTGTGTNTGTISTTGGSMTVGGSGVWSNVAANGVTATNATLTLGGVWSNSGAGTMVTSGSSINLGGTFTTAQALAIVHTGTTTISITGTMTNSGGTQLALSPATGSWYLSGGTIVGGTISGTDNERLIPTTSAGFLNGVTIAAGAIVDLSQINGAGCYLNNTVTINGKVLLGDTAGTTYGRLYWNSITTVWGGSGEIVYGANGSNGCFVQANNTSLTIASPLKIHGISGYFYVNYAGSSLINNGTISSDGGSTFTLNLIAWTNGSTGVINAITSGTGSALNLTSSGTWINNGSITANTGSTVSLVNSGTGTNNGTLVAAGGTLAVGGTGAWSNTVANGVTATNGTLTLGGAWSNPGSGTIVTSDSTINLGGTFTTAQALAVVHTGTTTISITGTMTNSGGTQLVLGPATGSWYMNGGTIVGGTITGTSTERLIPTASTNVLDGVTIAANTILDLSQVSGAGCYLNNTVTINGQVLLGDTAGVRYGRLYWNTATTVWGGSGEIVYGANGNNGCFVQANNTTLTIASPLKIHGIDGYFYANYSGSTLINNGTISSDGGGTWTLNFVAWTNGSTGVINALNAGSVMNLTSSGAWINNGSITANSGSTVTLTNSGTGTNNGTLAAAGGALTVGGTGAWSNTVANGVTATNGTLTVGGAWSNPGAGTIVTSGSSINLGGTFTTAQALAVVHTGTTTISITGTMTNTGGTQLVLGPATGSWYMNGGTIVGGTITGTSTERLIPTASTNVLDGVTIAANTILDLSQVNAAG
jgi:hypothetical protein